MTVLLDFPVVLEIPDKPILPFNFEDTAISKHYFLAPKIPFQLIDVVLLSSEKSIGLVWLLSEHFKQFKGLLYATPPVVEKIRVSMRELLEFVEFSQYQAPEMMKKNNFLSLDASALMRNYDLIPFDREFMGYSLKAVYSASGIGCCHWQISLGQDEIMFLENTLYNPIPISAEVEFKDKIVIVGSNAPVLEGFNDLRVASLLSTSIKAGRHVILPINIPASIAHLLSFLNSSFSNSTAIKIISSSVNYLLQFFNISSEYLSSQYQGKVYEATKPLLFSNLKIEIFDNLSRLSKEDLSVPCIFIVPDVFKAGPFAYFYHFLSRHYPMDFIVLDCQEASGMQNVNYYPLDSFCKRISLDKWNIIADCSLNSSLSVTLNSHKVLISMNTSLASKVPLHAAIHGSIVELNSKYFLELNDLKCNTFTSNISSFIKLFDERDAPYRIYENDGNTIVELLLESEKLIFNTNMHLCEIECSKVESLQLIIELITEMNK